MRTGFFYSLIFALLTSASITANAAPAAKPEASKAPVAMEASANVQSGKVNLNKADAPTLQRELSGVGEAKAKAIVSYRESNGPFASAEELLEVKGVGKALLEESREASGELSLKVSLGGRSLTGLFACAPGKARCALATSLAVMASLMTWS